MTLVATPAAFPKSCAGPSRQLRRDLRPSLNRNPPSRIQLRNCSLSRPFHLVRLRCFPKVALPPPSRSARRALLFPPLRGEPLGVSRQSSFHTASAMADDATLNAPASEPAAGAAAGEGGAAHQSNTAGDQGTCASVNPQRPRTETVRP